MTLRAFTFVELLVALLLSSIVLAAGAQMVVLSKATNNARLDTRQHIADFERALFVVQRDLSQVGLGVTGKSVLHADHKTLRFLSVRPQHTELGPKVALVKQSDESRLSFEDDALCTFESILNSTKCGHSQAQGEPTLSAGELFFEPPQKIELFFETQKSVRHKYTRTLMRKHEGKSEALLNVREGGFRYFNDKGQYSDASEARGVELTLEGALKVKRRFFFQPSKSITAGANDAPH